MPGIYRNQEELSIGHCPNQQEMKADHLKLLIPYACLLQCTSGPSMYQYVSSYLIFVIFFSTGTIYDQIFLHTKASKSQKPILQQNSVNRRRKN